MQFTVLTVCAFIAEQITAHMDCGLLSVACQSLQQLNKSHRLASKLFYKHLRKRAPARVKSSSWELHPSISATTSWLTLDSSCKVASRQASWPPSSPQHSLKSNHYTSVNCVFWYPRTFSIILWIIELILVVIGYTRVMPGVGVVDVYIAHGLSNELRLGLRQGKTSELYWVDSLHHTSTNGLQQRSWSSE